MCSNNMTSEANYPGCTSPHYTGSGTYLEDNRDPIYHQFNVHETPSPLKQITSLSVDASHNRAAHKPSARAQKMSLIDKIPTEILCNIFRIVAREYLFSIPSVLLVCRHFRDTLVADRLCWNSINIGTEDWTPEKQAQYIQVALQRSGEALFDITLDFGLLDVYGDQGYEFDAKKKNEDVATALRHVKALRGEGDCLAKRWRTLELLLPYDASEIAAEILTGFEEVETPNLVLLIIGRGTVEEALRTSPLFVSVPKLKILASKDIDLRRINFLPDSLEELSIVVDVECGSVYSLFQQTMITALELNNPEDYPKDSHESSDAEVGTYNPKPHWDKCLQRQQPITFGNLKDMIITGFFRADFYNVIGLPVLRNLTLHGEYALDILLVNRTFSESIREIAWYPPRGIQPLICLSDGRYRPQLVERLRATGQCNFPSLSEILLPKCCVTLVYPSLSASIQAFNSHASTDLITIVLQNAVPRIKV